MKLEAGGHTVISKLTTKYLGVIIDAKLNFKEHLEYAYQKVAGANAVIPKLLPNEDWLSNHVR